MTNFSEQFIYLRTRLIIVFCLLFILTQGAFFIIIDNRSVQIAHSLILDKLYTTFNVTESIMNERFKALSNNIEILASDFGLRSAISIMETDTIQSMMESHAGRIKADIMAILNAEGQLISLYPEANKNVINNALQPLLVSLNTTGANSSYSGMITINNKLYQIGILPVRAPELIAYVVVGINVGPKFIESIHDISDSDISFVLTRNNPSSVSKDKKSAQILATTFENQSLKDALVTEFAKHNPREGVSFITLSLNNFISYIVLIHEGDGEKYFAVIQRSWDEIMMEFVKQRYIMAFMAVTFIFFSIGVTVYVSRQITKPVQLLADAINQIEKGNYNHIVRTNGHKDEFTQLLIKFNNIMQELAERDQLKYLALHDPLTEIPNRKQFNKRLDDAVYKQDTESCQSALLLINLPNMRELNEQHGHSTSDYIMKLMVRRINLSSIRTDDIFARLGGSEFAILYDNIIDKSTVHEKVVNLIDIINKPFNLNGEKFIVNACIGVTMTQPGLSVIKLLEQANNACAAVQSDCNNGYAFHSQDSVVIKNV